MKVERKELKYYIGVPEYVYLSNILKKVLAPDKHNPLDGGYFIRSLYFDNLDNKAFEEKMSGIEKRKKYRLRLYDLKSKYVKLEIKSKLNYCIFKESAWITREDAVELQNGNYEVLLRYNNKLLNKVYCLFKKEHFHPVILVDYLREAYVHELNNIRVTFDRFLKSNAVHLDVFGKDTFMKPIIKKELIILEIKYNNFLPEFIKRMLQISRFERSAISKYCMSRLENN